MMLVNPSYEATARRFYAMLAHGDAAHREWLHRETFAWFEQEFGKNEDPLTISRWAEETFGPPKSNPIIARRALKELQELVEALEADDNHPKALEEVADVFIVLAPLIVRLRGDLQTEVNRKMTINRSRKWVLAGDGTGQHV